jgi:exocyst complex component 2
MFIPVYSAQAGGHEVWQAIWDMVKNISEVVVSSLPNFWKIARSFLEGKFKRVRVIRAVMSLV